MNSSKIIQMAKEILDKEVSKLRDKILHRLSKLPYIKVTRKAPGERKDEAKL